MDDRFGFPDRVDFESEGGRAGTSAMPRFLLLIGLAALLAGLYFLISRQGTDFADGFQKIFGRMFKENANQRDRATLERALRRGDYKAAVKAWDRFGQRLLQQKQIDAKSFHMQRAEWQIRARDPAAAAADYTKVLAIEPGNALALNNRAYMRALARIEIDEALIDVEEALKRGGPEPSYVDTKAYLLYLKGQHAAALPLLNGILDHPNRDQISEGIEGWGEIHFHRALVHRKLGNTDGFQADMEAARRLGFKHEGLPEPLVQGPDPALPNKPVGPGMPPPGFHAGKARAAG